MAAALCLSVALSACDPPPAREDVGPAASPPKPEEVAAGDDAQASPGAPRDASQARYDEAATPAMVPAAPQPDAAQALDAGPALDSQHVADADADASRPEYDAAPSDAGGGADTDLCADGFPRGKPGGATRLVHKLNPGPEGVGVCPNGDVLASAGEVLWRVPPQRGTPPERLATWEGRSLESIVCDAKGRIFVADISPMFALFSLQEPRFPPALMLLEAGAKEPRALVAPSARDIELTGFNGLLEIQGLGFYTTDMMAGLIVRYKESPAGTFDAEFVARDLPGANGLAYDPKRRVLYLVQTGMVLTPDRVLAIEMNADGTLGVRRQIWSSSALNGSDGLAIDENGVLYRADQLKGEVVRMRDEKVVAKVPNPASLAFRGGTLFISDFKMLGALQNGGEGGVYAVDLGVCGGATAFVP
ncbi:MAG TPA: SMP-30/gluconolactonase/LRE family protein [Polyangiales bacterium]